ncbi:HTH domain-containing protein [Candidatus Woesearchaeota archaeon]|nr:HTH domain-containing protein [Candidatus Woesearchaeota archaeon]
MSLLKAADTIKESFRRVKEHMLALEREIRANREFIILQNKRIEALEAKIKPEKAKDNPKDTGKTEEKVISIPNIENSGNNPEKGDLEENLPIEEEINHYKIEVPQERMGSLATPRRHVDTLATALRHPGTESGKHFDSQDIDEIKRSLNKVFNSLTNREFKVFMVIYSLEEQHASPTTYAELAQFLDLSSSSIRDYVSELLRKGVPIKKEKSRNGVAYVSVLKEFRDLNLISKLLAFRNLSRDQKSLFDLF